MLYESDGSVASGKHSQYMTGFAKRSPTELPNWSLQIIKAAIAAIVNICGFPTISQPD